MEELQKNQANLQKYQVAEFVQLVTWVKNVNCQNGNDEMRWLKRNLNYLPSPWFVWKPEPKGCYENISGISASTEQGVWEIEMRVTRNGVESTIKDTVHLTGQNGIDTLKLFY